MFQKNCVSWLTSANSILNGAYSNGNKTEIITFEVLIQTFDQVLMSSRYCMYSVVGVTSFGKSCARAETPAVYSRVASFVPWIESVVWP